MDETNWFYNENGKAVGPMTLPDLREQFHSGKLHPSTLVWHQTLVQWMPANQVPDLLAPMPPIPAPPLAYSAPVAPPSHHALAVTAFVLAIVGLVLFPCGGFLFGVPAIILAAIALSRMSRTQNREGYNLAVAAIIIGILASLCNCGLLFNSHWVHYHMYYSYPPRWNTI